MQGYYFRHGQWFETDTVHNACTFCLQALEVSFQHMADATLKTTKYTKRDGFDEPHQASVARLIRGAEPVIMKETSGKGTPVTITVPSVAIRLGSQFRGPMDLNFFAEPTKAAPKPEVNPCDLSDGTLRRIFGTTESNWDRAMVAEVLNLRSKLSRQRDVVLDLTEAEAATVLGLLDQEQEDQTDVADAHYQNGDGYEGECVQAMTLAADAEKIGDRLRKLLGKRLDKVYAGEANDE